jgi:hypothetical protein
MSIYMCERSFAEPITPEQFGAAGQALAPCLSARNIRWISSHFAADGQHSVCVFEAPDAELLREANHAAGLPFDRVWPALLFTP